MGFITGSVTDAVCSAVSCAMAIAFFGVGIFVYGVPAVMPQWWLMNGWWAGALSLAFLALLLAVLIIFVVANSEYIRAYVFPILSGGDIRSFEVDHRLWSVVYIIGAFLVNCFVAIGWITWNTYHDSFSISDLETITGTPAYETYNNLLVISCVLCLYGGLKFLDLSFMNMSVNQNLRVCQSMYDGFCSCTENESGCPMSLKEFCNSDTKKITLNTKTTLSQKKYNGNPIEYDEM